MLLQIFVSHLIWKPPPAAWLAHSSPDELLLGKSEGPPRKKRGHNQEQTFSRGRSDVFETSQFIPNCGQPPLLDVVCVPTQHSKHFWFQRASHSHHSQTFFHHFYLSFESRKPIPSYLYFALVGSVVPTGGFRCRRQTTSLPNNVGGL